MIAPSCVELGKPPKLGRERHREPPRSVGAVLSVAVRRRARDARLRLAPEGCVPRRPASIVLASRRYATVIQHDPRESVALPRKGGLASRRGSFRLTSITGCLRLGRCRSPQTDAETACARPRTLARARRPRHDPARTRSATPPPWQKDHWHAALTKGGRGRGSRRTRQFSGDERPRKTVRAVRKICASGTPDVDGPTADAGTRKPLDRRRRRRGRRRRAARRPCRCAPT